MIISIDVEKPFKKPQHPFMGKMSNKLGVEGTFLNLIKEICKNLTANVILNGERVKAFLQRLFLFVLSKYKDLSCDRCTQAVVHFQPQMICQS